jgi:hypothetical protein
MQVDVISFCCGSKYIGYRIIMKGFRSVGFLDNYELAALPTGGEKVE